MTDSWSEANEWERKWHGSCINSYNEESKQYIYAHYMGLDDFHTNYYGQRGWDIGNRSVLDMGCGPYSIMLKMKAKLKVGVDPCPYPDWVTSRYKAADIHVLKMKGEDISFKNEVFDIGLLYNCLQHTENPRKIVENVLNSCKEVRVFEWVETGITDGHIQDLTEESLNLWLRGEGKVEYINHHPVVGKAYYGIFKGTN